MTLSREKLAIDGVARQRLVIYHAQAGTDSADKLALLSSLIAAAAATPDRAGQPAP